MMVLIVRGAIKVIIIVGGDYDGRRCDIKSVIPVTDSYRTKILVQPIPCSTLLIISFVSAENSPRLPSLILE